MGERLVPLTLPREATVSTSQRASPPPSSGFVSRPHDYQESGERSAVGPQQVLYETHDVIGRGAFGEVMRARVVGTGHWVAIKRVVHDGRLHQRELALLRDHLGATTQPGVLFSPRSGGVVAPVVSTVTGGVGGNCGRGTGPSTAVNALDIWQVPTIVPYHPCIVELLDHFSTSDPDGVRYLLMVMDYVPCDVRRLHQMYVRQREQQMPLVLVKTIMFQVARALTFLHARGICHRDVKPNNILVDEETGVVKICDFGSAKKMQPDVEDRPREKNVPYIFARYYRAPELLLGSHYYRFHVDMWAFGCVLAELLCGRVLFKGSASTVSQLVEIIKVLGIPSEGELFALNAQSANAFIRTWRGGSHGASQLSSSPAGSLPSNALNGDYAQRHQVPRVKSVKWEDVLPPNTSEAALSLVGQLLRYTPEERLTAAEVLEHVFFDELFSDNARLPNGAPLPVGMFQVTQEEMEILPPWLLERMAAAEEANANRQKSGDGYEGASKAA